KWISFPLSVLLICSLLLAACTSEPASSDARNAQPTNTNNEAPKESANAAKVNPPGQFPIVNEKITLKAMVRGNRLVEKCERNEATLWLADQANIHADWIVAGEKN